MIRFLLILVLYTLCTSVTIAQDWILKQEGSGEESFGRSNALSDSGNRFAIGIPLFLQNGTEQGAVQIYDVGTDSFVRLIGTTSTEQFGSSVSLSDDGTVLAVGSPFSDSNGLTDNGKATIFKLISGTWVVQSVFHGSATDLLFGKTLTLNSDGTKLVVGAPKKDIINEFSGRVRTFKLQNGTWQEYGSVSGASERGFGQSVAISDDGTLLVVGSTNTLRTDGRIFTYEWIDGSWQLIETLNNEDNGENFGFSISLSDSGNILAISAPNSIGIVKVFERVNGSWSQRGNSLMTGISGDRFGYSIDLSSDGTTLSIGAPYSESNGTQSGFIRTYTWQNGWTTVGNDILGSANLQLGEVISLAGDGSLVLYTASSCNCTRRFKLFEATNESTPSNTVTREQSLILNGTTGHVTIVNNPSQHLTSVFTIEGWFRVESFNRSWATIIATGENSWRLHREANNNRIRFDANVNAATSTYFPSLIADIDVADGQWRHFAVTSDGTNRYLLIDGQIMAQDIVQPGLQMNVETQGIFIGENPSNVGRFFNGNVDEVRIWNTHRTPEQIRSFMYQAVDKNSNGLVGYYRFNEASGNVAIDEVGIQNGSYINVTRSTLLPPVGTQITGNAGWRLVSSPVNATIGDVLSNIWTQGFIGADTPSGTPNVYKYEEGDGGVDVSERGFKPISNAADTIVAGQGMLVFVYEDDDYEASGVQGGFPKVIELTQTRNSGTFTPSLTVTSSSAGGSFNAMDDGWHLVGNPYSNAIDWDATFWNRAGLSNSIYVWSDSANAGTGAYLSWNGITGTLPGGEISPFQGFWVKALDGSPINLTFTDSLQSGGQILFKKPTHPIIHLKVNTQELSNQAKILFLEDASLGIDVWDSFKLDSYNTEWISVASNLQDSTEVMDINSLPVTFEEIRLDIPVESSNSGEFELSWNLEAIPEDWSIQLIDHMQQAVVDLNEYEFYTFEYKSTKAKNRNRPYVQSVPQISKTLNNSRRFELVISSVVASKTEQLAAKPTDLTLLPNYPNPFNPTTNITYQLPETGRVNVGVYDITGRRVQTLVDGVQKAGIHTIQFNASQLSTGIYLYKIQWGSKSIVRKMTLIK